MMSLRGGRYDYNFFFDLLGHMCVCVYKFDPLGRGPVGCTRAWACRDGGPHVSTCPIQVCVYVTTMQVCTRIGTYRSVHNGPSSPTACRRKLMEQAIDSFSTFGMSPLWRHKLRIRGAWLRLPRSPFPRSCRHSTDFFLSLTFSLSCMSRCLYV